MSLAKRDPKSPYARYNKRPFLYSPEYDSWKNADDEAERVRRSATHSKKFLGFNPQDYPTGRYPR